MNSTIDEIKNKLDILEVIGGYIRLQKAGRNYKALCPFHSEKTPSFMVSPERQMWHCFGCQKGGSIFDFIIEIEGVEFVDALKILAQRAGVEIKKIDPQLKTERTRLYEICDLASQFFVKQLEASQAGQQIKKYLISRGLKPETIKEWQIGYAPSQWQSLTEFLRKRGYPDKEIIKAGIASSPAAPRNDDSKIYDRFRDRIIFPIKDINGLVVGFSGRENPARPDQRMGKYINTSNTLIFDKSRILYGLDKAKLAIKKNELCILVEGQMDVIMSHQSGFENVVASSGTALTEYQLKMLKRYTDNLAMGFDMDLAGEIATKRGAELAIQTGFNTKIISLPQGKDPADFLQNQTADWPKIVKQAQGLIEFYLTNVLSKNNPETVEGKKQISRTILPLIKKIPNKIEQAHWLQEISRQLKVREAILIEEMSKIKDDFPVVLTSQSSDLSNTDRKFADLEAYTLGLVLANPEKIEQCQDEPCYLFTNSDLEKIFRALKKNRNLEYLKRDLPPDLANQADFLIFKAEAQQALLSEFEPEKEIRFCFGQLRKRHLQNKLNQLNLAIQEAENKKDKSELKKLTEEFNQLSKQIVL